MSRAPRKTIADHALDALRFADEQGHTLIPGERRDQAYRDVIAFVEGRTRADERRRLRSAIKAKGARLALMLAEVREAKRPTEWIERIIQGLNDALRAITHDARYRGKPRGQRR
jgi:hypothetical protein